MTDEPPAKRRRVGNMSVPADNSEEHKAQYVSVMQQKVNEHLEKYSNPNYFGTRESRYEDHGIAEYIRKTGTDAEKARVKEILRRFDHIACEPPYMHYEDLNWRRKNVRCSDVCKPETWEMLLEDPLRLRGMSVQSISKCWKTLEMVMERRVTGILIGTNARVGAQSPVHRFVTHPLYERQLWRLIFEC